MLTESKCGEMRFKNEPQSSATPSQTPAAPKDRTSPPKSNAGCLKLLLVSLLILLLLKISFLIVTISFFQKIFKLVQEEKFTLELTQTLLECKKENVTMEGSINCLPQIFHLTDTSGGFQGYYWHYTLGSLLVKFRGSFVVLDIEFGSVCTGKSWSCCPKNWKSFRSNCYLFSYEAKNWTDSEKNCSEMQAHLLVVDSKEEQDFINKNVNRRYAYFLGLSDLKNGHWEWVNETPYNQSVTFWHPGEPNNDDEHCVILHFRHQKWGWNDTFCKLLHSSICEMLKIYL